MGRTSKQITTTGNRETEVFRYACLHKSGRIVFHMTWFDTESLESNDDILHWWKINMDYHMDKYEFIQSAWFAGANQEQLQTIAFYYWSMNDLDCLAYVQSNTGMIAERSSKIWKVYDERREFDYESVEGVGTMLLLAVIDYRMKSAKKENERACK